MLVKEGELRTWLEVEVIDHTVAPVPGLFRRGDEYTGKMSWRCTAMEALTQQSCWARDRDC